MSDFWWGFDDKRYNTYDDPEGWEDDDEFEDGLDDDMYEDYNNDWKG